MTPEQLDAIKGRLDALVRGTAYERYYAEEVFDANAESDIEALLEEVARLQEALDTQVPKAALEQMRRERDEARAALVRFRTDGVRQMLNLGAATVTSNDA